MEGQSEVDNKTLIEWIEEKEKLSSNYQQHRSTEFFASLNKAPLHLLFGFDPITCSNQGNIIDDNNGTDALIVDSSADEGTGLTCLTCHIIFDDVLQQKEHFKTAIHRINLRRRVKGLKPITSESENGDEKDDDDTDAILSESDEENSADDNDEENDEENDTEVSVGNVERLNFFSHHSVYVKKDFNANNGSILVCRNKESAPNWEFSFSTSVLSQPLSLIADRKSSQESKSLKGSPWESLFFNLSNYYFHPHFLQPICPAPLLSQRYLQTSPRRPRP